MLNTGRGSKQGCTHAIAALDDLGSSTVDFVFR